MQKRQLTTIVICSLLVLSVVFSGCGATTPPPTAPLPSPIPAPGPAPTPTPEQSITQMPTPAQALPTIEFDPNDFRFTVSEGEFDSLTGVLHISNSGGGTLNWSVSSGVNVTLSPTSGSSTGERDTVDVSIDIKGLSVGEYDAAIDIFAEDSSKVRETVPIKISIVKNMRYVYENGQIIVGGDGEPIELMNNPDATNPTYAELVAFIDRDTTDALPYIEKWPEAHVYADFAEEVHNNAEASGIRAAWVGIDYERYDEGDAWWGIYFEEDYESHTLNAFETTDKGLIYIDCTRDNPGGPRILRDTLDSVSPSNLEPWDTVAYIETGREYGRIGVEHAGAFSYSFYEEYIQRWQEYEKLLGEYNEDVTQLNEEIKEKVYEDESQKLAVMEAWELRIERKRQLIDELDEELDCFWYEPLGIVKDIYIRW